MKKVCRFPYSDDNDCPFDGWQGCASCAFFKAQEEDPRGDGQGLWEAYVAEGDEAVYSVGDPID